MLGHLIKTERIKQNMSQEALCKDICAPSYLSKIENDRVQCSEEIYGQLFAALNIEYIFDAALIRRFDDAWAANWKSHVFGRYNNTEQNHAELDYICKKLVFSPRTIDVHIAQCLSGAHARNWETLNVLRLYRQSFTPRQEFYYLYFLALKHKYMNEYIEAAEIFGQIKGSGEPVVYVHLSYVCQMMGDYERCIHISQEGFRLLAEQGNAARMAEIYVALACAYANLFMASDMDRCMDVVRELNTVLRNDNIQYDMDYNLGAARLVAGRHEEALGFLRDAVDLCERLEIGGIRYAMALQKLAFALIFLKLPEGLDAVARLKRQANTNNAVINASIDVLDYMATHPDYLQTAGYCELLERCFVLAKKQEHKGQEAFYGRFLIDAYKACRKYKKALEMSEAQNLSLKYQNR